MSADQFIRSKLQTSNNHIVASNIFKVKQQSVSEGFRSRLERLLVERKDCNYYNRTFKVLKVENDSSNLEKLTNTRIVFTDDGNILFLVDIKQDVKPNDSIELNTLDCFYAFNQILVKNYKIIKEV
jgi:hypothetical protein